MINEGDRERRGRIRVGYRGSVEIRSEGDRPVPAVIRDISINGLFVETEADLPEGRSCQVVVQLGQAGDQVLKVEGRVSRAEEGGLGIAFESIDPESFDHLCKLVLYNSPEPELIEREFKKPGLK